MGERLRTIFVHLAGLMMLFLSLIVVLRADGYMVTARAAVTMTQPSTGDGSESNPYQIGTAEELYWFANEVNVNNRTSINAKLINDIVLNNDLLSKLNEDGSEKTSGTVEVWTPIGRSSARLYAGSFDGDNHSISGMYMYGATSGDYFGLFGKCNTSANISNVIIKDSYICPRNDDVDGTRIYVGAICGSSKGTISNCSVENVKLYGKRRMSIGGICGENEGRIENCIIENTVNIRVEEYSGSSKESKIGGVCGHHKAGNIEKCINKASIQADGSNNFKYVGGICGYAISAVNQCINSGEIVGENNNINAGGICGLVDGYSMNGSYVSNCLNTGAVKFISSNNSASSKIGGIVGANFSGSGKIFIKNCCNTGDITIENCSSNKVYSAAITYMTQDYEEFKSCYYIEECISTENAGSRKGVSKTADQFASGEVVWLLNDGNTDGAWRQGNGSSLSFDDTDRKIYSDGKGNYNLTSKCVPTVENFIFTAPSDIMYDGNAKSATVVPTELSKGMGTISLKYYDVNGQLISSDQVKEKGSYTVKIDVAEGTGFNAVTNLGASTWIFTIRDSEYTLNASNINMTYGDSRSIAYQFLDNGNNAITDGVLTFNIQSGDDVIEIVGETITTKKAGDASVKITAQKGPVTKETIINISIEHKPVTIKAENITVYKGDVMPAFIVRKTGFLDGDDYTPTITCLATDTSKTGSYDIVVSGDASSDKYAFTYVKGTLTVSERNTTNNYSGGGYSNYSGYSSDNETVSSRQEETKPTEKITAEEITSVIEPVTDTTKATMDTETVEQPGYAIDNGDNTGLNDADVLTESVKATESDNITKSSEAETTESTKASVSIETTQQIIESDNSSDVRSLKTVMAWVAGVSAVSVVGASATLLFIKFR